MVKCPKGTIKNPETQNCVLIDGKVGKRILLERKLKRSASRKSPRKRSKCPKGTIKNPETQNCVLIDGKVGKRILLERKLKRSASRKSPRNKKCPKGTIKNPETQNCVLIDGKVGKRILLERKLKRSASRKSPRNKKCPKGTIKNPETQNCVLIDGKVGKRILLERKLKRSASSKSPRNKKCPTGTIFEKTTKDCVLIEGEAGKRILLEKKLKELASRGTKKRPSDLIWHSDTKKWVLIDGRVGKNILLAKKLESNSSASISTSSSSFPSTSISTSSSSFPPASISSLSSSTFPSTSINTSSSVPFIISSSNSSSLSDDLLTPLPKPIGIHISNLPPRPVPSLPTRTPLLPKPIGIHISNLPPRPVPSLPTRTPLLPQPLPTRLRSPEPRTPLLPKPLPTLSRSRSRSRSRSPEPRTPVLPQPLRTRSRSRSPSPEPRIKPKVHFDRLPPPIKRPSRSPSQFTRSPSPSRLPTRIEPTVFLPSPTIPEETNKDQFFPFGPFISKKIKISDIKEDCNYIKHWEKGMETGSGEVGKTRIVRYKTGNYEYVLKSQKKDTKFTSQFRAEIQALLELQGTDLVPKIYDVWTCNTMGYIIMEKLYNCDNIDPQELYEKIREKLRILRDRGWLHVDTHDGNVMCTSSGEPVIIDFGYAVKRKEGGDNATYPEHPKSQDVKKGGWGVALPWKFLEVMQEVNFHESFNPYGSKDKNIKKYHTRQNQKDYKNMQRKYKEAQQNLREEFKYRYAEDVLDQMSKYQQQYGT
jgi:hypothetical protein